MAELNTTTLMQALASHAMATGLFETTDLHEAKNAPGGGLRVEIWVQSIRPIPRLSGLASTSCRVEFTIRVRSNMLQEPQDAIDPAITDAIHTLMAAYSADFTLGGVVMEVDLLGAYGEAMQANSGYLAQDGALFRVHDITLPLVVADLWDQAA